MAAICHVVERVSPVWPPLPSHSTLGDKHQPATGQPGRGARAGAPLCPWVACAGPGSAPEARNMVLCSTNPAIRGPGADRRLEKPKCQARSRLQNLCSSRRTKSKPLVQPSPRVSHGDFEPSLLSGQSLLRILLGASSPSRGVTEGTCSSMALCTLSFGLNPLPICLGSRAQFLFLIKENVITISYRKPNMFFGESAFLSFCE